MKNKTQAARLATIAAVTLLFSAPLVSLAYTFTRTLCPGESGPDVAALQQFLKEVGYFTFPYTTGYFGPYTHAAVLALQKATGLPQTGCLDAQTEALANTFLAGTTLSPNTGTTTPTFDIVTMWNEYAPSGYDPGYGGGYVPQQQQQEL
jgi:peptidoglycan hydrolase-like protein with peptidoglycan-binding domain